MALIIKFAGGELQGLEAKVKGEGGTILTPYITLDTPGKAQVIIIIMLWSLRFHKFTYIHIKKNYFSNFPNI